MKIFNSEWFKRLEKEGRLPQVTLGIKPLSGGRVITIDKFTAYNFSSSIVVPIDAFSFSFVYPDDDLSFNAYVRSGDIATLYADNIVVCTGIIDTIEVEVDGSDAERVTVTGRDMLSQLEDNAAISIDKKPIYGDNLSVEQSAKLLIAGTRIKEVSLSDAPKEKTLLSTALGESRLSALLRHCEPVNALFWSDPYGNLVVGRPAFNSQPSGVIQCSRKKRKSNVLSIRSTEGATSIPNRLCVLWSDLQVTGGGLPETQIFQNKALGPSRLRNANHNVIKCISISLPSGADSQGLAATAVFQAADAAGSTVLQAAAKRELARANFNEHLLQAVVPGHFNENGELYLPNTVYNIEFDRANIDEKMFLYSVEWNLTSERGSFSVLSFCNLNTIVSDSAV